MTGKKPQLRVHVEFSNNVPLAVITTILADLGNAVKHQHIRQRQLRIAGPEQFTVAARNQLIISIAAFPGCHREADPWEIRGICLNFRIIYEISGSSLQLGIQKPRDEG